MPTARGGRGRAPSPARGSTIDVQAALAAVAPSAQDRLYASLRDFDLSTKDFGTHWTSHGATLIAAITAGRFVTLATGTQTNNTNGALGGLLLDRVALTGTSANLNVTSTHTYHIQLNPNQFSNMYAGLIGKRDAEETLQKWTGLFVTAVKNSDQNLAKFLALNARVIAHVLPYLTREQLTTLLDNDTLRTQLSAETKMQSRDWKTVMEANPTLSPVILSHSIVCIDAAKVNPKAPGVIYLQPQDVTATGMRNADAFLKQALAPVCNPKAYRSSLIEKYTGPIGPAIGITTFLLIFGAIGLAFFGFISIPVLLGVAVSVSVMSVLGNSYLNNRANKKAESKMVDHVDCRPSTEPQPTWIERAKNFLLRPSSHQTQTPRFTQNPPTAGAASRAIAAETPGAPTLALAPNATGTTE